MWLLAKPILSGAWAFLRGLPWQLCAGLALLALGLFYGHLRYQAGQRDVQAKFDQYRAVLMQKTEAARIAAKRAEAVQAGAIAAATDKLKQDNADARAKADRTIADLRAGALRVQPRFKCPARHLPGTPAGSEGSQPAGEGGLSDQDAEFLIRFASGADAAVNQLTACQSILKADRP